MGEIRRNDGRSKESNNAEELLCDPVVVEVAAEGQPMPDSRRMEDLMGSGELERRRSRRGDLREAMVCARQRGR